MVMDVSAQGTSCLGTEICNQKTVGASTVIYQCTSLELTKKDASIPKVNGPMKSDSQVINQVLQNYVRLVGILIIIFISYKDNCVCHNYYVFI